jgi:hypothetical protein
MPDLQRSLSAVGLVRPVSHGVHRAPGSTSSRKNSINLPLFRAFASSSFRGAQMRQVPGEQAPPEGRRTRPNFVKTPPIFRLDFQMKHGQCIYGSRN